MESVKKNQKLEMEMTVEQYLKNQAEIEVSGIFLNYFRNKN